MGQYPSLEHVPVSTSRQMPAPSDITANNIAAKQPPYIITYCINTTLLPLPTTLKKKFCIKHIDIKSGNYMCNMFFSRPTCLSRTVTTHGLIQICLLEENFAARMAYHTNVQFCPKLLSLEHIHNNLVTYIFSSKFSL